MASSWKLAVGAAAFFFLPGSAGMVEGRVPDYVAGDGFSDRPYDDSAGRTASGPSAGARGEALYQTTEQAAAIAAAVEYARREAAIRA